MSLPERDLSGYIKPPRTPAELQRTWRRMASAALAPAAPRRRWVWRGVAVGLAGAIAVLVGALRLAPRVTTVATTTTATATQPFVVEGARLENTAPTARPLRLADGSLLVLGPAAEVVLERSRPDQVRVVVQRGSADFDVTHVDGRRFTVAAAGVDVVVIGTRFVVTVSDGRQGPVAAVSVQRGAVEVRRPRAPPLRFAPGQSWSSATAAAPEAPVPTEPPASTVPTAAPGPGKAPTPPSAKALLATATHARLRGDHPAAADALDRLCRLYPGDPTAPLAAFQLGRIRGDNLHQAAGAATAFHLAARLTGDATLREAAAAREVEALEQAHAQAACRAARDAYRATYPTGPHLGRVAAACRER